MDTWEQMKKLHEEIEMPTPYEPGGGMEWVRNMRRDHIESGHGGDHDEPYEYQDVTKLPYRAMLKLLETLGRVAEGKLGGEEDGHE